VPENHDSWSRGYRLIQLLSSGRQFDAAGLGAELQISPDQVLDELALLQGAGLQVMCGADQSYRLSGPVELLDASRISADLAPHVAERVGVVEVLGQVDSSNSWLLKQPRCEIGKGRACLAEIQTAGRGRRGRQWMAPPTGSLCLSLAWHFPGVLPGMSCLSLACGIAVVRALEELGVQGVSIKWPNDLMWQDRKLAGLLVEMRSDGSGSAYVVIGLGLNLDLGALAGEISTAWGGAPVDLAGVAPDRVPGRNALAAAVLNSLTDILLAFPESGFAGLREQWQRLDGLTNRRVSVEGEGGVLQGTVLGVDDSGALRLMMDGEEVQCVAGEVSVRPVDATAD
jgi:BirA family biotin operon repressor/biotin-[acetyl-CoA-carboxylase] ligase